MEYMSTYIYTGLALVIVVGSMTYFGAFNPSTYTKENCESGTQLRCQDSSITTNGEIKILLSNQLDREITINNYTFIYEDISYTVTINDDIKAKENITISYIITSLSFSKGKKESVSYEINYHATGSNNNFIIRGTATTRVEEGLE